MLSLVYRGRDLLVGSTNDFQAGISPHGIDRCVRAWECLNDFGPGPRCSARHFPTTARPLLTLVSKLMLLMVIRLLGSDLVLANSETPLASCLRHAEH